MTKAFIISAAILLFSALSLKQLASENLGHPIDLNFPEETLATAKRHSIDYPQLYLQAIEGKQNAIQKILDFYKYTDAAASLGHRSMIYQLGEIIGRDQLIEHIDQLHEPVRNYYEWYKKGESPL